MGGEGKGREGGEAVKGRERAEWRWEGCQFIVLPTLYFCMLLTTHVFHVVSFL